MNERQASAIANFIRKHLMCRGDTAVVCFNRDPRPPAIEPAFITSVRVGSAGFEIGFGVGTTTFVGDVTIDERRCTIMIDGVLLVVLEPRFRHLFYELLKEHEALEAS